MNYTEEQKSCIEEALNGESFIINACPGSGKTHTLVGIGRELSIDGKVGIIGCYNKDTANELGKKTNGIKNISALTMHSLAYRVLAKDNLLDTSRVGNLTSHTISKLIYKEKIIVMPEFVEFSKAYSTTVGEKMAGFMTLSGPRLSYMINSTLTSFWNSEDYEFSDFHAKKIATDIINYYQRFAKAQIKDINENSENILSSIVAASLTEILERTSSTIVNDLSKNLFDISKKILTQIESPEGGIPIPFDYFLKKASILLAHKEIKFPKIDYLMVDEGQDSNGATLTICKALNDIGVQIISAGDPLQQINSWRSSINAFEQNTFRKSKSLTQCFRFGPEIATLVNNYARESMIDTNYDMKGNPEIKSVIDKVGKDKANAVLCRSNAAVIDEALKIMQSGGTPWAPKATELLSLIDGIKKLQRGVSSSHPELCHFGSFDEYVNYAYSGEDPKQKSLFLMYRKYGPERLEYMIKTISVKNDRTTTVVSTIHSSKGLEWPTVVIAGDIDINNLDARRESHREEYRLFFVALTRAKYAIDPYEPLEKSFFKKLLPPHKHGFRTAEALNIVKQEALKAKQVNKFELGI